MIRRDPYFFIENICYLLDRGSLTLNKIGFGYPSGYVIVTSGFLLIWSDYLFVFFFVKMASIFYIFLYILISFIILKNIFKNYYLVFFSLLLLYLSNFFLSRNILNIPSTLGSLLVLISMLMVAKEYPLYTQGFILAGIFLVHPLTFVFYIIVFGSYILFKIVSNILTHKMVSKDLLMVFWMIIIFLILFMPYFYNYKEEMSEIYSWYENIVNSFNSKNNYSDVSIEFNTYFLLKNYPFIDFLNTFLEKGFVDRFYNLMIHSIDKFFYATILGIFLNLLIRNRKIVIFNFSVIFVFASSYVPFFFSGLNALDFFKYRSLEIFVLSIIIMATFFIKGFITIFKKIIKYFLQKFKTFNIRIDTQKFYLKYLKVETFVLLFIFANTCYMILTRDLPEYYYNYDDEYVSIILYVRQNLVEPNSEIYHPYFINDEIHSILYDMRCYYYNLSETPKYNPFYRSIRRADFLIINKSEIPGTWITYLSSENRFGSPIINLTNFLLFSKNH